MDISLKALEKARKGLYTIESFRNSNAIKFQQHYFGKKAKQYHVVESMKNTSVFIHGNLIDEQLLSGALPYDVIFCRNFLIYFK